MFPKSICHWAVKDLRKQGDQKKSLKRLQWLSFIHDNRTGCVTSCSVLYNYKRQISFRGISIPRFLELLRDTF